MLGAGGWTQPCREGGVLDLLTLAVGAREGRGPGAGQWVRGGARKIPRPAVLCTCILLAWSSEGRLRPHTGHKVTGCV